MVASKTSDLPARWAGVRRQIERWRGTREVRSRIPDWPWASAAEVAGTYGIHRAAKALRLNYYTLQKRVPKGAATVHRVAEGGAMATFVELPPPVQIASGECVLEVENAGGAKMRMRLKGVAMPDLTALSRNFWNHGSDAGRGRCRTGGFLGGAIDKTRTATKLKFVAAPLRGRGGHDKGEDP